MLRSLLRERPALTDYDPIPEGAGRLYVYRPASGGAALGGISLTLNGEPVARLSSEGYVSVVLPRGEYLMSNDIGFAVSEFRVGSGRVLYCGSTHYSDLMGSHWRMPCSNDAEAHAELRKYRRQEIDPESPWAP